MPHRPPRHGALLLGTLVVGAVTIGVLTVRRPSSFRAQVGVVGNVDVVCGCPCEQRDADACADQEKILFSFLLEDPWGTCINYCDVDAWSSSSSSSTRASSSSSSKSAPSSSSSTSSSASSSSVCAACGALCSAAGSPACDYQNEPTCASTDAICPNDELPVCDENFVVRCPGGGAASCEPAPQCLRCITQKCGTSSSASKKSSSTSSSKSTTSSSSMVSSVSSLPSGVHLACDRRLLPNEPVMCFIHTNADDPRFVTTFFVPPYMSLNPLATDGNPLGTSVGDRVKGISCEVACGRIRDIGLCCRKRIPGEPDCPVLRVGECEATGRGITIPFSLHSDVCLGYMSSGACGF